MSYDKFEGFDNAPDEFFGKEYDVKEAEGKETDDKEVDLKGGSKPCPPLPKPCGFIPVYPCPPKPFLPKPCPPPPPKPECKPCWCDVYCCNYDKCCRKTCVPCRFCWCCTPRWFCD
jgi:hypothetical protein